MRIGSITLSGWSQCRERYSFKVYAIRPLNLTGLVRRDINDHRAIGYWHIGNRRR